MGDLATLVSAGAAVLIAATGGFFKLLSKIEGNKIEIVDRLTEIYNDHEKRDQDRHEQNVTRLTRLETLVNGSKPRSRRNA